MQDSYIMYRWATSMYKLICIKQGVLNKKLCFINNASFAPNGIQRKEAYLHRTITL